jgi:hypothetical protein
MTHPLSRFTRSWRNACLGIVVAAAGAVAHAAPGAHGPDGEHLDAGSPAGMGTAAPRIVATSELFELVASLDGAELAIVVDRYATNEPVLDARLDVESGALKARATYRAGSGDYVVTDAALLNALAAPGQHGVVFTLIAGTDADLLEGTLVTPGAADADHGHPHGDEHDHDHHHGYKRPLLAGAGVLALLGGLAWWRQRRRAGLAVTPGERP